MSASGGRDWPSLHIVVGETDIRRRVVDLAARIAADYEHRRPMVVVGVMKGALLFVADLVRHLRMPLQVELVNARSYRQGRRRGRVVIREDLARLEVAGKHVLAVDCVLDTGHTLAALRDGLRRCGPASLEECVLLAKKGAREVDFEPRYVGLQIPDLFVVGYGLDYDGRWRHLPCVAALQSDGES